MKLLLATMKHETNTFSQVATPLERFFADGKLLEDSDAVRFYTGTGTVIGAFLEVAELNGAQVSVPVAADAWPSGPVEDQAYEELAGRICNELSRGGFDGVLLDLHGAMVSESYDDGEGELLRRMRAIDPAVPIAVALDMHANVSPEFVQRVDILAGYQTYPHVDEKETGLRVATMLMETLRGELRPTLAWAAVPMLPHVMAQSSLDMPNKSLQQQCKEYNRQGVRDASLFTGFPHADTYYAGLSAVVITNDDSALAIRCRDELVERAWKGRSEFLFEVEPLPDSIKRAQRLANSSSSGKPIFLLDHYDNAASGGSMRRVAVLDEIQRQGLKDLVFFALLDSDAAAKAHQAGLHQRVTLQFPDSETGDREQTPYEITGTVSCLSDGRAFARDHESSGLLIEMGASAVISFDSIDVIVVSMPMEPYDLACFKPFGIDPATKQFVVLKSRVHWRAAFDSMASTFIPCAGTGACTSDYSELDFKKVRRPIYPLDADTEFLPKLIPASQTGLE